MHNIEYLVQEESCNKEKVMDYINKDAEQNGDGYWGSMRWNSDVEPLKDYEAARKWIEDHDRGGYDGLAVRYYGHGDKKEPKNVRDIVNKVKEEKKKLEDYKKAHSVVKFKADLIGCQHCGSKLARKYLRGDFCPLCQHDMRSKTTLDTIHRYEEKIRNLEKRHDDLCDKNNYCRIMWLIKYEYHS